MIPAKKRKDFFWEAVLHRLQQHAAVRFASAAGRADDAIAVVATFRTDINGDRDDPPHDRTDAHQ